MSNTSSLSGWNIKSLTWTWQNCGRLDKKSLLLVLIIQTLFTGGEWGMYIHVDAENKFKFPELKLHLPSTCIKVVEDSLHSYATIYLLTKINYPSGFTTCSKFVPCMRVMWKFLINIAKKQYSSSNYSLVTWPLFSRGLHDKALPTTLLAHLWG